VCCAAFAARAGEINELHTAVTVEQDYDSNIFFTDKDPTGSAITIIRPALSYENHGTLGHTQLYGFLSEHLFWSESKLSGIDRGFGGDISRKIFPRTTLFATGSYQRLAAHPEIRGSDIVTTPGSGPVPGEAVVQPGQLVEGASPDTDIGQGTFGVRQELTPRLELEVSGGPYSVDYLEDHNGLNQLRDRNGWYGGATFTYLLSPIDRTTLTMQGTGTDFSDAFGNPFLVNDPSDPHTVNINTGVTTSDQQSLTVGWTRSWSELWSTTIAVGGRRLHTRTTNALRPLTRVGINPQIGVVPFTDFIPVGFDDTGPGVVGEISVTRELPRGQFALSYSRETRTTSSLFASNVNVDTYSLGWVHRLSPRVTFSLRGTYEHYQSVNDNAQFLPAVYGGSFNPITGPDYSCPTGFLLTTGTGLSKTGQCEVDARSSLNSDLWTAVARVDWQLRRRLSTFVVLRYGDRNGDVQLFGQNYDKYNVGVGFRYDYALGL
jgi:hypothetical protein